MPDLIVVKKKKVWLIDVAIPAGVRIEDKECEKVTNLQIEIEKLGGGGRPVMPIVLGGLGAKLKCLEKHLYTLGVNKITPYELQWVLPER